MLILKYYGIILLKAMTYYKLSVDLRWYNHLTINLNKYNRVADITSMNPKDKVEIIVPDKYKIRIPIINTFRQLITILIIADYNED